GEALLAGPEGPSPLSDPPRLRGCADLPRALRPVATGGRGHDERDAGRFGAVLRRRCRRYLGQLSWPRSRRQRKGPAARPAPGGRPHHQGGAGADAGGGGQGQRPRSRLDPARRLSWTARGGRSALDASRLPDLLRALGDVRGAQRPAGQRARPRVGLLLARTRVARSRERRANGQRNLEATDLGGSAGGNRRAGDRGRAPALRGDLAPRLQRGATRMTDGEGTQPQPQEPAASPPPSQAPPAGNGAKAPEDMTVGELVFEDSDRASVLVREEIELAKTEVTEKFNRLLRGSVVGLVAGI